MQRRGWILLCCSVVLSVLFSSIMYMSSLEDSRALSISYRREARGSGSSQSQDSPMVTYFLMDSFVHQVFERLHQAGRLPHMDALIRGGGWVRQGVTTFPSITGYAFFPMLTGQAAPYSQVYGLRWFDRRREVDNVRSYVGAPSKYMNDDLTPHYKLLFEEFAGHYTSSAQTYLNRGVSSQRKSAWYLATAKYGPFKWYLRLAKIFGSLGYRDWLGYETDVIDGVIEDALTNRPKVQWVTLGSPDGSQHVTGTDEMYDTIIEHCDKLIGEFVSRTQEDGSYKDRLFVVVSDHGAINVAHNLDLVEIFGRHGLDGYLPPSMSISPYHRERDISWFSQHRKDAMFAINGNTMAYVYLSNPELRRGATGADWQVRLHADQLRAYRSYSGRVVDLLEVLSCETGFEFVMAYSNATHSLFQRETGDHVFEVRSCHSSALIHRAGDRWAYAVQHHTPAQSDPFLYLSDPSLSDRVRQAVQQVEYLTRREWMEATLSSQYPLGVVLAEEILRMPGSGDLILTSQFEYDFAYEYEWFVGSYRGGHGGIHRNQTVVPMMIHGHGVAPGSQVECATTADLGATVRYLMGLPHAQGLGAGRILSELVADPPPTSSEPSSSDEE